MVYQKSCTFQTKCSQFFFNHFNSIRRLFYDKMNWFFLWFNSKKQVKISSYINIIINKIERILSEKCKVSQNIIFFFGGKIIDILCLVTKIDWTLSGNKNDSPNNIINIKIKKKQSYLVSNSILGPQINLTSRLELSNLKG